MNIEELYNLQKQLQQILYKNLDTLSLQERLNILKNVNLLGIILEVAEVIQCLPYKFWRKSEISIDNINREVILEELIDIFAYLLNCFIIMGYTPSEIEEMFKVKWRINNERFLSSK